MEKRGRGREGGREDSRFGGEGRRGGRKGGRERGRERGREGGREFTDTLCYNVPCSFFNTLMSEQNIPERGEAK